VTYGEVSVTDDAGAGVTIPASAAGRLAIAPRITETGDGRGPGHGRADNLSPQSEAMTMTLFTPARSCFRCTGSPEAVLAGSQYRSLRAVSGWRWSLVAMSRRLLDARTVQIMRISMSIQPKKLGAAALVTAALLGGQALAQTAAPAPAAPGAPAGQPQQNPNAPVRIDMQVVPKSDWTKVCSKPQTGQKELCFTTRDFTTAPDQPPPVALAVYDVKGDENRIIRVLMPIGLLLKPGVRFSIDKGATSEGSFEFCMPNGCFAETRVKGNVIEQMKKGKVFNIVAKGLANNEVTFGLPIEGFGKAFDGAAVPADVIAKQQQEMQADLQKQLQAQAEARRKQLEQQSQQAPAAAPAGGAAAPAAKP